VGDAQHRGFSKATSGDCKPMGRPLTVNPQQIETAGMPVKLKGRVKDRRNGLAASNSSNRSAGCGDVGVMRTSTSFITSVNSCWSSVRTRWACR
jgi:hypothetical protein